jgi:ribosomal protein S18 acetylase RimI-like enzyme
MKIRRLFPADAELVRQVESLFDHPSRQESARSFLENPHNYLLVAWVDGDPAGFVTGHLLQRLDTRPMLFLYEAGVAEAYRGRGIGTALVRELARIGEQQGFCEMFVLTNASNEPAMRMYASAGGIRSEAPDIEMFEWSW